MKKNLIYTTFIVFLTGFLFAQDFTWAKGITGSGSGQGYRVYTDALGNVYTIGEFKGTMDFDPSSNTLNYSAAINIDYFITKMDSSGNLIWAKHFGGGDESAMLGSAFSLAIDNSGNIYAAGSFTGSVDFDPGPNSYIMSTSGIPSDKEDFFILKLDNAGNFIWAKSIPLTYNTNQLTSIAVDNYGDLYFTGSFYNTVDFDSGPGISNISGNPMSMFICKYSSTGNFLWVKRIGNYLSGDFVSSATGYYVTLDNIGNISIVGEFNGTIDFDSGTNIFSMSATGYSRFILKLDSNGNFISSNSYLDDYISSWDMDVNNNIYSIGKSTYYDELTISKHNATGNLLWKKSIPANNSAEIYSISLSQSGNIYIAGSFTGTFDFDSGIGIKTLSSYPKYDGYIGKLDSTGNLIWVRQFGGSSNDAVYDIKIDAAENIYATGFYKSTADFDPDTSTYTMTSSGSYSSFVLKLKKNICADLTLHIDTSVSITCNNTPGFVSGHGLYGLTPYNYSWNTSPIVTNSIATISTPGIYQLTVTDANSCSRTSSVTVLAQSQISGYDLNTNLISGSFRSGFPADIWLEGYNKNCMPVTGKLKIVLDSKLTFNGSAPSPTSISADTLIWDFVNLTYDSTHVKPHISVTVPTYLIIGDTIYLTTIITPITGDLDTLNNTKHYSSPVINAYDPNVKEVFPKGKCKEGYVLNNQMLTYSVRFQNTGNADAINITVLDELDKDLDISSLKIVGYSHSVFAEILEHNVVQFHFNNIHLADSGSNEPASHGYVIFEINPTASLTIGTEIKNKAGIYFDFNSAVITNEVINTITDIIPESCSGIREHLYDVINIYPNPTTGNFTIELSDNESEIEIINLMGQLIYKTHSEGKNLINIDLNCSSGIYFVKIIGTLGKQQVLKLIKN